MRLRPVNVSRRSQLDQHKQAVIHRIERQDDRLKSMGFVPDGVPDVPQRDIGSLQGVRVFRPAGTFGDTLHPDAHEFFDLAELAAPGEPSQVPVLNRLAYRHIDCVPDSEHGALVGFQTEAQEQADKDYEKKRRDRTEKNKRRAIRAGHKVATDLVAVDPAEAKKAAELARKYSEMHREANQETADRLKYGFYTKTCKVAGEVVQAFNEYLGAEIGNKRSCLGSPSLARMAALYPRKGLIRAGYDKGALFESPSKLFALDAPYAELNKKVAGCIVVELDSVLRPEEFYKELLNILGPRRMPNLIVGRISPSGFLVKPHLIWILKKPVWYQPYRETTDPLTGEVVSSGDRRCRKKPIRKFHAVQRALTQLLLPLGADPACTNVWKPKCPLSAFWTAIIANDDNFHALDDFEQIKDWPRRVDEAAMAETAAKMRAMAAGATMSASNLIWNTVGALVVPEAYLHIKARDPDFIEAGKKGVESLAAWFDAKIRPEVEGEIEPSQALERIMERRCKFTARWCLGKLSPRMRKSSRGRDRDIVFKDNPNPTPKNHREEAGKETAKHRRALSVHALCKEAVVALWSTGEIRRAELIKTLGTVGRSTAYAAFDQAMERLGLVEVEDGVFREPTVVQRSVRDGAPKIKSKAPDGSKSTNVPASACPASSDSPRTPAVSPGHPVQTVDPPLRSTVTGGEAAGPPDPPWEIHAKPSAEVRQRTAIRMPEPA